MDLEPDFGVGIVVFPGLGLLASANGGGIPGSLPGVVLTTVEDRLRGVPSMGVNGFLWTLAEARKLLKPRSDCPELEPGRLPAFEDCLVDPSEA